MPGLKRPLDCPFAGSRISITCQCAQVSGRGAPREALVVIHPLLPIAIHGPEGEKAMSPAALESAAGGLEVFHLTPGTRGRLRMLQAKLPAPDFALHPALPHRLLLYSLGRAPRVNLNRLR